MFPLILLFLPVCLFSQASCQEQQQWQHRIRQLLREKLRNFPEIEKPPKNVIFFLGDGMGLPAVTVARIYKGEKLNQSYSDLPFAFERFQYSSLVKTSSFNKHVTDSAASAVALFCGYKVDHYTLGLLPGRPTDCSTGQNDTIRDGIAELALKRGLSVGFVTTDRVTGATPAAMYAKGVDRKIASDVAVDEFGVPLCRGRDIGSQLLQFPAAEFKVLMGGGSADLLPTPLGQRNDERNIVDEWLRLGGNRLLVNTTAALETLDARSSSKVFGLFARKRFPYFLDEVLEQRRTVPRLKELTEKAIQIMERDNTNGYFLMIEGGNIDVAEHRNEMRMAAEELLEFDAAVAKAREMTSPAETLIVVTADHSHALSLPGYMDKSRSIFGNEKWTSGQREDDPKIPGIFFAVGPGADRPVDFTEQESKDPHFVSPAAIYAVLGSHGGEDVGLWADGPHSRLFSGSLENSEVAHLIKQVLCLYPDRADCVLPSRPHRSVDDGHSTGPVWIAILSMVVALLSITLALLLVVKRGKN